MLLAAFLLFALEISVSFCPIARIIPNSQEKKRRKEEINREAIWKSEFTFGKPSFSLRALQPIDTKHSIFRSTCWTNVIFDNSDYGTESKLISSNWSQKLQTMATVLDWESHRRVKPEELSCKVIRLRIKASSTEGSSFVTALQFLYSYTHFKM